MAKLKKTLYVGVGGTGIATLLKVKKCFVDSYGEIPPMIGFLAIDTDGAATGKSVTSNKGDTIKLSPAELLVCTVKGALAVYNANHQTYNWVPSTNVNSLVGIQGGGAGQVRSNGRFIAYYNNVNIKNDIQSAINKINAPLSVNSLYEVDKNVNGMEYPININVVASIAGGTGSGMLIDVLCLIRSAMQQYTYHLYPWIVLPEVFRAMSVGPSMANVLYNTYGALKELDYFVHHDINATPIDLGYTQITDELFDYAYIINNTNEAGTIFGNLDSLTDVIAKSMFLPANKMGDAIQTPFDNIRIQQMAGTYDIRHKKAWAATASSAELLYDGQAVGRAYAYQTIHQLCESMRQSPNDGTADANAFVDDPNVLIQEHERDDVIDSLLSPGPDYMLQIDENTTAQDIQSYIEANRDNSLKDTLTANLEQKINAATNGFSKKIDEILCRPEGKVGAAIKFIVALQAIIAICVKEMNEEEEYYKKLNQHPIDWNVFLNAVRVKGIASLFKSRNDDQIDLLQAELTRVVTNLREEIRRDWALKFYTQFNGVINQKLKELKSLDSMIKTISKKSTDSLVAEQQRAKSPSLFQIFLHKDDVLSASSISLDDNLKNSFLNFLVGEGLTSWINQSPAFIEGQLWNFAKNTGVVLNAVNTKIDDVLRGMKEADVKKYLEHIKDLASPLWTYNTWGYNSTAAQLDQFVIIGVGNRDTSVLKTDSRYNTFFDSASNQASFASTNQDDRVYILVVEDLLPIYAVNSFDHYEMDNRQKTEAGVRMSNYIDANLNKRMNQENFKLVPAQDSEDELMYWVYGFVFGLINRDDAAGTYWMRSTKMGSPFKKYRFDLGNMRDAAFDVFKKQQLYAEIKETLDKEMAKSGKQPFEERLDAIKADGSYYDNVSQLSQFERDNIDDPHYGAIKDLVEKEIRLMTD